MPVVQHFTIELPKRAYVEGSISVESDTEAYDITRDDAESLYNDLGMALYPGGVGGADVPAQRGSVDLAAILASLTGTGVVSVPRGD